MYQKTISEISDYEPRHIEAWLRADHGTLDSLTRKEFEKSVKLAETLIETVGPEESEALAKSYGL